MVVVWCLRSAQQRRRWRGGVNEERQREKQQQWQRCVSAEKHSGCAMALYRRKERAEATAATAAAAAVVLAR